MGYEASMRLSREEVLADVGVPPAIAGDYKNANYAQVEMQLKTYWTLRGIPLANRIADGINRWVLPKIQPASFLVFDTSGIKVLQEDLNAKAEREERMVRSGLRARKGLREADRMPAYPG